MSVDVPAELAELGYSGLFWLDATVEDPQVLADMAAKAPALLGNTGWAVLGVVDDPQHGPMVRVVRRDSAAIWDLVCPPFVRRWTR